MAQELPMLTKLHHPETIEALFAMAGGDTKLVDRAIRCADRLDAAHLLKSVEYIIAH